MPKNYNYAYQNIKHQLSKIQKTLGNFNADHNIKEGVLAEIQQYRLNEEININTTEELKALDKLLKSLQNDEIQYKDDAIFQVLKIRIERLDYPDLETLIQDMEECKAEIPYVETKEAPQIVYRQEYSEEYGATIMRPYQLIDGALHPCHIDREGNVTLMGDDSYS